MLVGRLTKDSADLRRATVDFITNNWLDSGETITSITTPAIVVEQNAVVNFPPGQAFPAPVDSTPLTLASSAIVSSSQKVKLMLSVGTPGLTYKVTFVATGTSGRHKQVDLLVSVREPV